MKTLEEQLWDYIDGTATAEESELIKARLIIDLEAERQYQQLLEINTHFQNMEIDAPSMSFTRNVMEQVALELPPVSLKTQTDKRIIYGVGGFFLVSLFALCFYTIYNSTFQLDLNLPTKALQFDLSKIFTGLAFKIFLFVDLILALVYFDGVLRRRMINKRIT